MCIACCLHLLFLASRLEGINLQNAERKGRKTFQDLRFNERVGGEFSFSHRHYFADARDKKS